MRRLEHCRLWHRPRLVQALQLYPDLVEEAVYLHVDGNADRVGEAESIGRAMALHRDSPQAQEHSAVVAAWIASNPEFPERPAGKEIANSCQQLVVKGRIEELGEELGRSLSRLYGHIPGEAVSDDDIDGPRCNIIALDKSIKLDRCHRQTQPCAGGANGIVSLQVLGPDIEQAHGGL